MDWKLLLDLGRLGDKDYIEEPNRPIYVQDADRIVFSQPFRRLANKTQVHPLNDHDHIHHRLIHSVETASVGRSLGMSVGHWLEEQRYIEPGEKHVVAGLVHAACLAHDIGNPPFGHSGEAAIGSWFKEKFSESKGIFGAIEQRHKAEFCQFEGNAQGFRILARLEMYRNEGGMRLSKGVLSAFSKYPVTGDVKSDVAEDYCGVGKFGIFHSELEVFREVAEATGLIEERSSKGDSWWRRHPLVFLVEAADDICYNILDLEDGVTSGDLPFDTVSRCLSSIGGVPNASRGDKTNIEWIAYLRARSIGVAVQSCVECFKLNYEKIMSGTFSSSLVKSSEKSEEFREIKAIANARLFTARRKTELEVSGRNSIRSVLSGVLPVMESLKECGWKADELTGYQQQLVRAIDLDLRDALNPYSALHVLADFVSGMTDRYAVKVARMISGN
jgi:dGTPase